MVQQTWAVTGKEAKDLYFCCSRNDQGHEFDLAAQRREQKSFGSFLQKRTFF